MARKEGGGAGDVFRGISIIEKEGSSRSRSGKARRGCVALSLRMRGNMSLEKSGEPSPEKESLRRSDRGTKAT